MTLSFSICASAQTGTPPPGGWHRRANPATPSPAAPIPATALGQTATPPIANSLSRTQLVPTQHPVGVPAAAPKNNKGEQFFIVASVDLQKSQLLLKYPTEVTLLVKVDPKTTLQDESGKPLKLTDFRAGNTVWVTSATSGGEATAKSVRKGEMTVADLHKYYLDYAEIR